MACSVTATAPIVVCSNTVFWCAISLASSMNFSFFSSLANRAQSCLLYSINSPKSFLYRLSSEPSYTVFFSPSSCSPIASSLKLCLSSYVYFLYSSSKSKCTRPTRSKLNCSLPYFSNTLLFGFSPQKHNLLVSSPLKTFCILPTVYGISYPSEFQPESMSASSTSCRNASNMFFSFSNSIVFSNLFVSSSASFMLIVFGGTARVTS